MQIKEIIDALIDVSQEVAVLAIILNVVILIASLIKVHQLDRKEKKDIAQKHYEIRDIKRKHLIKEAEDMQTVYTSLKIKKVMDKDDN